MMPTSDPTCASSGQRTDPVLASGRVLIADDDPDCRDLLVLALTTPGVELWIASNGVELLEIAAERGPFDLIITDIDMPWIQGLQVLASFREAGLDTPVLVVSGLTRRDLLASIAAMGRARLLPKPFTVSELRSSIAELLAISVPP